MADSLGTAKVQADLCDFPHESKTDLIFASLTTVYTMVCLFVALRFATRLLTRRVRADDWCILAALLLATATYISAYKSMHLKLWSRSVVTNSISDTLQLRQTFVGPRAWPIADGTSILYVPSVRATLHAL